MRTRDYRGDNVIDSRDVIRRIADLQEEVQDAIDTHNANERQTLEERGNFGYVDVEFDLDDTDALTKLPDLELNLEVEELIDLLEFQAEAQPYAPDWRHGATLVNASYFSQHCEEVCKDCGDIPDNVPYYIVIDWDATADNLRADYAEAEFSGEAYYVRKT